MGLPIVAVSSMEERFPHFFVAHTGGRLRASKGDFGGPIFEIRVIHIVHEKWNIVKGHLKLALKKGGMFFLFKKCVAPIEP